jgi:aspartyl protease family protein
MTEGPWGAPQPPATSPRRGLLLWLCVIAALIITLLALDRLFPSAEPVLSDPYAIYTIAWVALLSSGLIYARRLDLKQTARNILLWLAVGSVIMIGFVYQDAVVEAGQRLRSALIPGHAVRTGTREMTISETADGSYVIHGEVNGARVRFLVDTGASDIVLSPADASRAGIDTASLKFEHMFESANGLGRGASFTVASLKVGHIALSNVTVSINQAPMSTSLLGMAFLRRLKSFEMGGRQLKLRW